jgi:hypothetical protein
MVLDLATEKWGLTSVTLGKKEIVSSMMVLDLIGNVIKDTTYFYSCIVSA